MISTDNRKSNNIISVMWFMVAMIICSLVIVGLFGCGAVTSPLESEQEEDLIVIVPAKEASRLPSHIIAPFILEHVPLMMTEIGDKKTFDAVMISRATLDEARADRALRDELIQIAQSGCVLLIYDASPRDLVEALEIESPSVMVSPNTVYLLSSIVFVHDIPIIGNIVASSDNPYADDELGRDIKAHVERILLTMKELA